MLETQRYLKSGKTLGDLEKEFAISASYHPDLPLCILNYSQLDSPKTHPIVIECRSLILELDSWNLVSQAFPRFFNLGEALEVTQHFNWHNYKLYEKVDGSLIQLFFYNGWRIATRSTFGHLPLEESGYTWKEFVWSLIEYWKVNQVLNRQHTYVFELCSLHNQNVTIHIEPHLNLLDVNPRDTIFIGSTLDEHILHCDELANALGVKRPKRYDIKGTPAEIKQFVDSMNNQEEGLVAQDYSGMRIKIKNTGWLALASLTNNGNFYYKDLYDVITRGEESEISVYFPLTVPKITKLKQIINDVKSNLTSKHESVRHISDQKEYALKVLAEDYPLRWVLFECKRHTLKVGDIFLLPNYADKIKRSILELV